MTTYKIEYDLTELKNLANKFKDTIENAPAAALPNTANALAQAAKYVHNMWTGYLTGSQPLNGIDFMSGVTSAMVRSIRSRYNGDLSYTISSDNRQLEQKVHGSKEVEYDMKQTHPYGKKSRVSKKGIPYLIIPFRWGTPNGKGTKRAHFNNVIPQASYETSVKGLAMSKVNIDKKYFEANVKGENIERQGYDWAKFGRLTEDQAWDDRSIGMVRMKDMASGKSTYFTFRIISAKSPENSWIYHKDAIPAVDMMGALVRTVKPQVDSLLREGVKADEEAYKNMR
jgi:hypothetical protein